MLAVATCLAVPAHGHGVVSEKIRQISAEIAKTPDNGPLYMKRGRLYLDEARYRRAMADFRKALRIAPDLHSAWYFLAQAQLGAKQPARAEISARRFMSNLVDSDRGGHIRAHLLLGQVLTARGKLDRAADHYYRAFVLSETPRPRDVIALATTLARANRTDDALRAIDAGIARLGSLVTLERHALRLETGAGRYDAAQARLDRLIADSEMPAGWMLEKARLLRDRGDEGTARQIAARGLHVLADLPATRRRTPAMRELQAELQALR